MSAAAFPILGTAFVLLLALPLGALLAKLGLVVLERREARGPLHGLNARYLLLAGSSLLPIAWFASAGVHQLESGSAVLACLFDDDVAEFCSEPGFFVLALALGLFASAAPTLRRTSPPPGPASPERAAPLLARLRALAATRTSLVGLQVRVTEEPRFALATYGWLRPYVVVGTAFAARLSDEMLASALAHEAEHVRNFDPLRFRLLQLALAVNPLGRRLLLPHAARWQAAREAHCDREAVLRGARPLPLADALVQAARPGPDVAVALGARDAAVLTLRVRLLLAFAERPPVRCCRDGRTASSIAAVLLLAALALPHDTGSATLDAVHVGAEHMITWLWL